MVQYLSFIGVTNDKLGKAKRGSDANTQFEGVASFHSAILYRIPLCNCGTKLKVDKYIIHITPHRRHKVN